MTKTFRVYFAETAQHTQILQCEETLKYVRQLKRDEGTYLASTRADYLALILFRTEH